MGGVITYILIILALLGIFWGILTILVAIYYAFERRASTGEVKKGESKDYKLKNLDK